MSGRQEEKRRDNFKGEIVRYLPNKLVTGLDDKVPSWEIQVSNTKSNLPDISRVDLTDFERLVNNLRAAMNDVDPSASGLRGSQSSGGVPSNDSISKLQATLLKTLPQIDAIIPDFDRILIKAGLCERATKLEEENAKLKGILSERSGIPVNSPNIGDRSVGQSPNLLKRQLSSGGKAFSLGTMDSRSTDVYEVARAEETIKAYERSRNDQASIAVGSFSSPPQPAGTTQLLASLRSDEKEIRKRLRELEDDVRCQTLQLVGLRDEVGLGVEGDDMFHEVVDDEEGTDESEQDALLADETDTSLVRSSVLALPDVRLRGHEKAGVSPEEAVSLLSLKSEVDNLSRQLREAEEEAEKHRVAHAEEVQVLNTQLQEVTGGLTSEVASLRRTLEAAEATMAEHRDTAEQLKGKLRLTLEERDSLERTHEAALSAADLRTSAAAAQASSLADRLDDWQLVCRLALEQVAQRHDALMRVAAAVSDAMADVATDFTFGDAARSFLANSTDTEDPATADDRHLGIPGDTVDPAATAVATATDVALLLPPLKAHSVERPSSSSSSSTSDADGVSIAAPSDTDSAAASPRSSAVLRPLPSTLAVAAAAADATDAVRDAYLAVVASAADDVDFSDWAARAVAAVDLIRSRLKETRGTLAAKVRQNMNKITFRNFAVGDLALFLPTRNPRAWAAFNVNSPHHFLSLTSGRSLFAAQMRNRDWILAAITAIDLRRAGAPAAADGAPAPASPVTAAGGGSGLDAAAPSSPRPDAGGAPRSPPMPLAQQALDETNPFGLAVGTRYYWCDAVPWSLTE
ncbi:oligomeric, coiled-coil, peripheral membrane protein [Cladochytrium tenue]|nr:oligomeric, coiled-coil, peripheral membrane protein [Cladochytrium tenue]